MCVCARARACMCFCLSCLQSVIKCVSVHTVCLFKINSCCYYEINAIINSKSSYSFLFPSYAPFRSNCPSVDL